jgi:chromosome partition protein MukE
MHEAAFAKLEDVLQDPLFPEIDMALRAGRHIDRDESVRYVFLLDAQSHLETFYRRYGCEFIHAADGYFYLLPTDDQMGRRHLSAGEMLVGQTLALLYLDPATLQAQGVTHQAVVVSRLEGLVGEKELVQALNPRRRKYDQRVAQETVRLEIAKALRGLAMLGFVDLLAGEQIKLRMTLLRFADAVRVVHDPVAAMAQLIAEGKAVIPTAAAADNSAADEEDDDEPVETQS